MTEAHDDTGWHHAPSVDDIRRSGMSKLIFMMAGLNISINWRGDQLVWQHNVLRSIRAGGVGPETLIEYLEGRE